MDFLDTLVAEKFKKQIVYSFAGHPVTMVYNFIQHFVIAFQLTVLISECRYHYTEDK